MASGLAIPVRAFRGRAVTEDGSEQLSKVIFLAMGERDNDNPFNQIVGIRSPLFMLATRGTRALIQREIELHFQRLSRRGRALLQGVDFTFDDQNGRYSLRVNYEDLELNEPAQISRAIRRA